VDNVSTSATDVVVLMSIERWAFMRLELRFSCRRLSDEIDDGSLRFELKIDARTLKLPELTLLRKLGAGSILRAGAKGLSENLLISKEETFSLLERPVELWEALVRTESLPGASAANFGAELRRGVAVWVTDFSSPPE